MKADKTWLPYILLGAALLYAVVRFVMWSVPVIVFPYPVDYGEGPLLDQTMRLAAAEPLYDTDFSSPPYTITNYTPLYILVQAPFAALFGSALWYGRLLSALSMIGAAAMLGTIINGFTENKLLAYGVGAALLANPFVVFWGSLNRVDSLALFLSLAALAVIVSGYPKPRAVIVGGILLVAAVYTRQSYGLAAPFAAAVFYLSHRDYKSAGALTLLVGVTGIGLLLGLNALTEGGFLFHIVVANVNPFSAFYLRWHIGMFALSLPVLIVFGAAYLGVGEMRKTDGWWFTAAYLVGGLLSALTVGKVGSNLNYMLELSAALILVTGLPHS